MDGSAIGKTNPPPPTQPPNTNRSTPRQPNTKPPQILHCRDLVPVLARLRGALKARLRGYRDGLGVNVAGLRLLKREVAEDRNAFVVEVDGGSAKKARV